MVTKHTPPAQPAQPSVPRRWALWVAMAVLLLLAVVGLWFIQSQVDTLVALAETDPDAAEVELLILARKALAIPSALLAVAGLLMARMAWRAWRTATFPPTGTWLLRATAPTTGAAAKRRAVAALAIAMLTLTLAIWLPREVVNRLDSAVAHAREQRAPIEWNRPTP